MASRVEVKVICFVSNMVIFFLSTSSIKVLWVFFFMSLMVLRTQKVNNYTHRVFIYSGLIEASPVVSVKIV